MAALLLFLWSPQLCLLVSRLSDLISCFPAMPPSSFPPAATTVPGHAMNTWAHLNTSDLLCKSLLSSRERPQHKEGAFSPSCFEDGAPLSAAHHGSHRALGLVCEAVGWEINPEDNRYFCLNGTVSPETITAGQDWRAWSSSPQP